MKKIFVTLLMIFCIFAFVGCNDEIKPESIIVQGKQAIFVGDSFTLGIKFAPQDVTNKDVTYSVDPADICSVKDGVVTAKKAGSCVITVTSKADPSVYNSINITVAQEDVVLPTSIKIVGNNVIEVNKEADLFCNFIPENTTTKTVKWESSNSQVIKVNENGHIVALKKGEATIKAISLTDEKVFDELYIKSVLSLEDIVVLEDISLSWAETDENGKLVVGNTFKINVGKIPTNANNYEFTYEIENPYIATVSSSGVVTTTDVGKTKLIVKDIMSNVSKELEFEIVNTPQITDFSVNGSRDISIDEVVSLSIATTPKYAVVNYTYELEDNSMGTIENDVFKPAKTGTVVIKVYENSLNKDVTVTFKVTEAFDENTKPSSITINGQREVYVGYNVQFSAIVYPEGVSQLVTWSINQNKEGATISDTGLFCATKTGDFRVVCKSAVPGCEKVKTTWNIVVKEEPKEEPYQDLKGAKIVVMNADSALKEIDPFHKDYNASDKLYKQKAQREVEQDFNCTISFEAYPNTASWGQARIDWIVDNAKKNTSGCDFGVVDSSWLVTFATSHSVVDLTAYFKKYGKNQISTSGLEQGSIKGSLYAVSTGLSSTKNYPYFGLFYNYGLLQKYNLESPAKLFNDGKWSYDEFVEYCKKAQAVLGENEYVVAGAPSIMWNGMCNASGIRLADKNSLDINITHQYSIAAIDAIRQVVEAGAWDIDHIDYDEKVAAFQEGRAIFQPGEYWFVNASNRFPIKLFGENTQYGYVPFPYAPNVGKEGTCVNDKGESIIVQMQGRGLDASMQEGYYRAMLNFYLRTIEYQEKDPQFDSLSIRRSSLVSKMSDEESIVATMYFDASHTLFDPIFDGSFATEYGSTLAKTVNSLAKQGNATEELAKIYSSVRTDFIRIYG